MVSMAGVLAFLGGAKRWCNPETFKALGVAIAAVCLLTGAVLLFGAGGAGREAKVNWRWLQKLTAINQKRAIAQMELANEVASAANQARLNAEFERNQATFRAIALEQEIAKLKNDPEIYTRDERRRLFKR